jgi:uncharacterized protein (DUF2249 family)/iron-sulfur cluster repair protein YtfE (RIC family)
MSSIVLATSAEDSRAVEAVVAHHTEMNGTLGLLVEALVQAAESNDAPGATTAHRRLVEWTRSDLLPHAQAEEEAMYPHAHRDPQARLLVDAMIAEHHVIGGLVDTLDAAASPVRAAALGRALQVLFDAHMTKENEQILPLLAQSSGVSLAGVLDGMHDLLGHAHAHDEDAAGAGGGCGCGGENGGGCGGGAGNASDAATGPSTAAGPDTEPTTATPAADRAADDSVTDASTAAVAPSTPAGHSCGCGGHDDAASLPVLDARAVPHAIRHATIFGALEGVAPGAGMVLLAPHDPLPLLAQIDTRWPGAFTVDYLERGPQTWALAFTR